VKQKKRCLQGAFFAERVAVLRQSNSHHRTGNSVACGAVEGLWAWNGTEKNKVSVSVPWFRAKLQRSQPWWLVERATAKKWRGDRCKNGLTSGEAWERFCRCWSHAERRKRTCEDWERSKEKKSCFFSKLLFFLFASGLWNGRRHDWLEQPSGTKRTTEERPIDCLFLLLIVTLLGVVCLWLFARHLVLFLCISLWCRGFCVLQNVVLSVNRCFGLIDWL
jgi:hypothetical protein